ncbi:hypothetical protein E4U55_004301 [Claviceps digitariae]|nr:hypothetical protein E4U55_004301 [Claviceps digitariae]
MTEYWKNSPNYWCKHCAVFVRDTKLERQNHEATARHQNAIKRSLRELHRTHDREQRDKERARREIERLEGVVGGEKAASSAAAMSSRGGSAESGLKEQREQLARMGVSIPSAFLPDMAMAGEWTVVEERVVGAEGGEGKDRVAMGVRKRGGEEEKEEQDAVRGLFKRPRRWGRDTKTLGEEGGEEDAELDALLRGGVKLKGEQQQQCDEEAGGIQVKDEDEDEGNNRHDGHGTASNDELGVLEEGSIAQGKLDKPEEPEEKVKQEEDERIGQQGNGEVKKETGDEVSGIAPVVFKKRKPKGLRTR